VVTRQVQHQYSKIYTHVETIVYIHARSIKNYRLLMRSERYLLRDEEVIFEGDELWCKAGRVAVRHQRFVLLPVFGRVPPVRLYPFNGRGWKV